MVKVIYVLSILVYGIGQGLLVEFEIENSGLDVGKRGLYGYWWEYSIEMTMVLVVQTVKDNNNGSKAPHNKNEDGASLDLRWRLQSDSIEI